MNRKHHSSAETLSRQLPRYLLRVLSQNDFADNAGFALQKTGAFLFCDISGFTPLTERFGKHGKAGTETLSTILNDYFEILIGLIEKWDGDVVKFSGDAITVLFEQGSGEQVDRTYSRACAAALDINHRIRADYTVGTRWGDFLVPVKIGISFGDFNIGILGDCKGRMEHIVSGLPLNRMVEAEHLAAPGEIVIDDEVPFPERLAIRQKIETTSFSRLTGLVQKPEKPSRQRLTVPQANRMTPFLLPSVWKQVLQGGEAMLSEHRPVVSVFTAFKGLDYLHTSNVRLLNDYFCRIAELLTKYGGAFSSMDMGDKGSTFLCFFGAPESYGNNEERAVAFSLELKKLEELIDWLENQQIGISYGTAYCGVIGSQHRQGYTTLGDQVNVAARLMQRASKSGILATKDVRKSTRDLFRWGPYRSLRLKGKQGTMQASTPLQALRRKHQVETSFIKHFVGRNRELKMLQRHTSRSWRTPMHPAIIVGEVGIGKTELLRAFLSSQSQKGTTIAFGSCPAFNPVPFEPWIRIFLSLLEENSDHPDTIGPSWSRLLPDQHAFIGLGLNFLGLNVPLSAEAEALAPRERQEKVVDLLARTLILKASHQPVIIVIDDLHNADEGSLDYFSRLTLRLKTYRVMFLATARPTSSLPDNVKVITLSRFSVEEARELNLHSLGASFVPGELERFLYNRSGGNPFFLIELHLDLKERKVVTIGRDGRLRWDPGSTESLPGSVEEIILTRLDRLPLLSRNIVKIASCLGMSFDLDLLQEVFLPYTPAETLAKHLTLLNTLGIVPDQDIPTTQYTFSHATIREVAYEAVLLANRRKIHLQAGEYLEKREGGRDNPSLLAYHFGASENWQKALEYDLEAAQQFMNQYAFQAAFEHYGKAKTWARQTRSELGPEDKLAMADAAIASGAHEQAGKLIDQIRQQTRKYSGLSLRAGELQLRLFDLTGQYKRSTEQSRELLSEAEKANDEVAMLAALRIEISGHFRLGKLEQAARKIVQARRLVNIDRFEEQNASLDILEGAVSFQKGEYQEAINTYTRALDWAHSHNHYPIALRVQLGRANVYREMGKPEEAIVSAKAALELANLIGSQFNIIGAATTLASAYNGLNQPDQAWKILVENEQQLDLVQSPYAECSFLNQMGVTQHLRTRYPEALSFYRKCRSKAIKIGNRQWIAFTSNNIADILKNSNRIEQSLQEFRRALRSFYSIQDIPYFIQAAREILSLYEENGLDRRRKLFITLLGKMLGKWKKEELLKQILD